jgi:hypothetical protein
MDPFPSSPLGPAAMTVYSTANAIEKSNLPAEKKTEIRRFFDNVSSKLVLPKGEQSTAIRTASEVAQLVRADVESAAAGLGIAYLEHVCGEKKVMGKRLADFVAPAAIGTGALWAAAAPALGMPELAAEGRNLSSAAVAIQTYKMGKRHYGDAIAAAVGPSVTGEGEDPELQALADKLAG